MHLRISHPGKVIRGKIRLPSSKSISNRLLILNALAAESAKLDNLSDSDDTRVLLAALEKNIGLIDIGHAGTAMRFLTAYLCLRPGNFLLTGSGRMKERPIAQLVDALRSLGADIRYPEKKGFPPLEIRGKAMKGGRVQIDSSISSQYISALMMIAPVLDGGLHIQLDKDPVSSSYLHMTSSLMQDWGVTTDFKGRDIIIPSGDYLPVDTRVEGDWSAAGYWYAMVGLAEEADIVLEGLQVRRTQGDAALMDIFQTLGVESEETEAGMRLRKIPLKTARFSYDFSNSPDLVQTLCVYCGLQGIPFELKGTQTLRIKETDRVAALQAEMRQFGVDIQADEHGSRIWWDGPSDAKSNAAEIPCIPTYKDHRMAMSFAVAALLLPSLIIEEAEVVRKSYPSFWEDMMAAGFEIAELPA